MRFHLWELVIWVGCAGILGFIVGACMGKDN